MCRAALWQFRYSDYLQCAPLSAGLSSDRFIFRQCAGYLPGYHSDVDKVPEDVPSYPLIDLEFNITLHDILQTFWNWHNRGLVAVHQYWRWQFFLEKHMNPSRRTRIPGMCRTILSDREDLDIQTICRQCAPMIWGGLSSDSLDTQANCRQSAPVCARLSSWQI